VVKAQEETSRAGHDAGSGHSPAEVPGQAERGRGIATPLRTPAEAGFGLVDLSSAFRKSGFSRELFFFVIPSEARDDRLKLAAEAAPTNAGLT